MALIKKIDYKGNEFNNLHKYEIELEDHGEKVIGYIYKKQNEPYFKVDDEVEYTINDKGTLKLNKPGQDPNYNSAKKYQYNPAGDEEIRIARSVAIKEAMNYGIYNNQNLDKIFKTAQQITAFITKGETDCCDL